MPDIYDLEVERLPLSPSAITPDLLPVFAEWQRRLDIELNRDPPETAGATMAIPAEPTS